MGNTSASMTHLRLELSQKEFFPGDYIYTPRGLYDHHGIYIGDNLVIHFQNSLDEKKLGSSIRRFGECPNCGHHSGKSGVVRSCLDCFRRGGVIHRYIYGCRLRRLPVAYMKICTTATSDDPETVIKRAKALLIYGFGDYDLLRNNCEDFALFCKSGQEIRSSQVLLPAFLPVAVILALFPFALLLVDFDSLRRKKNSSKYKP